MKEIIDYLRAEALENIADGVDANERCIMAITPELLTNSQALRIAAALEIATYPPIVLAALAALNHLKSTNRGMSYMWATIDKDQDLRLTIDEPMFNENSQEWNVDGLRLYIPIGLTSFHFNTKDMLFHRTADGWQWVGNPNNQKTKQDEQ